MKNKLTMLMILDGFGINEEKNANAIELANTPNIDRLIKTCPTTKIKASGLDVGLPEGQVGNAEVGHVNIGAGRIVIQDLTRITKAIEDGDFFSNEELINAIEYAKKNGSKLHVMGLLSDGGVHSHIRHLYAILELAKRRDFEDVYVHAFLDGKDTPSSSGEMYITELENKMKEKEIGKIASISGRFYSMDRDNNWDRTSKAYRALVYGEGEKYTSAISAIEDSYQKEIFDEFMSPMIIVNSDEPIAKIEENDSVIFFNFRPDRARQLTKALVDENFKEFEVRKDLNLYFVCMTPYDKTLKNTHIAFEEDKLKNTFGEYISNMGYSQLRIAEKEKYRDVTFFFDGKKDIKYDNEDKILIPSKVDEIYDLNPEMNASYLTDRLIDEINSNKYDVVIVNYANPDMVGHTGNLDATIKAVEVVDECIGRVVETVEKQNGVILITSDHGNVEQMIDYKTGEPNTAHTINDVPLILVGLENVKLKEGSLSDIAPTILDILNIQKPEEMTGKSIIVNDIKDEE